jgi:hypothetical protein
MHTSNVNVSFLWKFFNTKLNYHNMKVHNAKFPDLRYISELYFTYMYTDIS